MTPKMIVLLVGSALVGAAIVGAVWVVAAAIKWSGSTPAAVSHTQWPSPTLSPISPSPTVPTQSSCPSGGITVTTGTQLRDALKTAHAGSVLRLAAGTYLGNFVATAQGTRSAPIWLCGAADAILDGGNTTSGYVFHLDGARYWHLVGFSLRNGQKGLVADSASWNTIEGLSVSGIGDEGVHLRTNSTDNLITGNTVNHTGLLKAKFGEGIYIGTARSNWCTISNCQPDRSDDNTIVGNTISDTTAENIDIKEGTTGGIVRGNSFNGTGMVESAAKSWVNVKGNGWTIEGNTGVNSIKDGFESHQILDGWGTRNIFRNNSAAVNGPGFGINLTPALENIVECNNTVTGAARGTSNVPCAGG